MSIQLSEKATAGFDRKIPPGQVPDGHENCTDEDCHVCMRLTIPQHIDCHGTKIEDLAGTGEMETLGG
ncbi:MAG: hypothetical protein HY820_21300 [Acidobacteria bacterium]|nr:hypothetical protein [Acidobacteriota bacterium]